MLKLKRWSRPAYVLFAVLVIAAFCVSFLPPMQIGPLSFGGAGVAFASTTETFTTSGNWTCPAGVTSVQVEVWGAGAGASGSFVYYGKNSGNGGGGGAYARLNSFTVIFGGNYTYVVGLGSPGCAGGVTTGTPGGDSWFNNSTTVKGAGAPRVEGSVGNGGTVANSVGDVKYAGGAGFGATLNGQGGGGGGSGGSAANGNPGNKPAGATAVTGGGPGGAGVDWSDGQPPASGPGGGGGGGYYYYPYAGGAGYNGQIKLTYTITPPTIATLAATSITTTSVTLNGNVTSLGSYGNVTRKGFVLSTSTQSSPGNVSPSAQTTYTAGNWTWTGVQYGAGQTFNSDGNVTGLSKGACYHFRAAGYSTYGWAYGDELTFPTLSDAPTGCTITAYTSFSISWSWTNGAGYGNSTWRYKTGSYPTSITDGTSAYLGNLTSTQLTGLTGNTTYYFTGWSLAYCNGATSTSTGNCSFTQTTRVPQIVTLDLQVSASSDDVSVGTINGSWVLQGAGLTDVGIYPGYYISIIKQIGGGMLFRNATIPDDAIILTAWLELKCNDAHAQTVMKTKIVGDKPISGNSSTFSTALDYEQRRGIAGYAGNRTGNETLWDGIPAWASNYWYDSPEIKNIVQEQIDNPNWVSGNSLAYFWDDHDARGDQVNSRQRAIYTWDNANPTTLAPKLHIEYIIEPTNVYAQTSHTLAGTQLVRACLLASGARYLAVSTITTDGPITIYAADANWTKGAQVGNASDFHTFECFGGIEYSTLGSPLGANIILFWGRGADGGGFIATYNVGNDTWTHAHVASCVWVGDAIYRAADSKFYINSSFMQSNWGAYYNKLAYSTLANLLTPANWVTINLPAWGGPSHAGIYYEEPKAVIFGNYMYVMQQDDYTYYWRFFKWNFTAEASPTMDDGNFTLIDSSTDTTVARPKDVISLLGSTVDGIAVGLPYSTPYSQWQIKFSADGTTWTLVTTLSVLAYNNEVSNPNHYDGCENFCQAIPIAEDKVFVQIIAEGVGDGYSAIFDVDTGVPQAYYPGTLGYSGDSSFKFVVDGDNYVLGEQNYLGDARISIYEVSANISNTPASKDFGLVQPSSVYSTGIGNFTLTNNSSFAVDVSISGTDMVGGTTWTLSDTSTPGANIVGLMAGTSANLTTFIEVDPNLHISVTSSRSTATNVAGNESCYLYKDYGVDYFSDYYTFNLDINMTDWYPGSNLVIWALTDIVDNPYNIKSDNSNETVMTVETYNGYYEISLVQIVDGIPSVMESEDIFGNTTYYIAIVTNPSILSFDIYSTPELRVQGGEGDVSTDSQPRYGANFRYAYATSSWNAGATGQYVSGYIENYGAYIIVKKTPPFNNLATNIPIGGNIVWGIKVWTPTNSPQFDDGIEKLGNITLAAETH